ncbi:hypothetical protein ACFQ3K_02445 [Brucella gallinifaecis]|uniref:Transporter n=1 Tax=Brucella gallinifaecis TaxID=215590 RepID=A0A502BNV6_9HYPH|nr:hypothetical protein [Brucella gallinifaecis]TPF75844.1 hypothetical protein FHY56_07850 [Brucella gallinifaecis]
MINKIITLNISIIIIISILHPARSDSEQNLAKKLANPVSNLISVPLQSNYDCCYGPKDAYRYTLKIQPVVPFSLNSEWNIIARTIVPIVYQQAPADGFNDRFGLSDIEQSFFFSPKETLGGITWGFGPVLLWPTATSRELGTGKWGAGPTGVILRQHDGWTYGTLANHIWSYMGNSDRADINQSFIQPFITYNFPDTTALSLSTETSYDWTSRQWTVPVNAGISKVFKFGEQRVSIGVSARYYAQAPSEAPKWGARFVTTFLFPER